MKALKDLFHNINDILVALIILIIAAFLIFWRVEIIMAYPDTLAKESNTTKTTQKNAVSDEKSKDKTVTKDNKDSAKSDSKEIYADNKLTKSVSVTIPEGSYTDAVKALIDKKLFSSDGDFEQACAEAGVDPNSIKASTFSFEAGETKVDIARTVTQ